MWLLEALKLTKDKQRIDKRTIRVYNVQTKDRQKTDTKRGDDDMTIYTEKAGAFSGLPDIERLSHEGDLRLELDQLPKHQSDTLCRVILSSMAKLFEDPAVKEDYEKWKAAREAAKA